MAGLLLILVIVNSFLTGYLLKKVKDLQHDLALIGMYSEGE